MRQNRGRDGRGRGGFGGGFRRPGQNPAGGNLAQELFQSVDANNDRTLSAKEWTAYFGKVLVEADADKNGSLSAEEWQAWRRSKSEGVRGRPDRGLKVGAPAPKVKAEFMTQNGALDFNKINHLSVVIFGSYT
jgi:hypothetical protein